jgi:hypothetical protein
MLRLLDGAAQLKDASGHVTGATGARMLATPSHLTERSVSLVNWRP